MLSNLLGSIVTIPHPTDPTRLEEYIIVNVFETRNDQPRYSLLRDGVIVEKYAGDFKVTPFTIKDKDKL